MGQLFRVFSFLFLFILPFGAHSRIANHIQKFDVDQCLDDLRTLDVGVSCLFASSNADCEKNLEAYSAQKQQGGSRLWQTTLPGEIRLLNNEEWSSHNFQIPSPSWVENVAPYAWRLGVSPPSYMFDALMVARYGVMAGGAMSWAAYLVAITVPDKGAEYICNHSANVGQVALNPVCHKSILRPQVYELLRLTPEARYRALTLPQSSFYAARRQVCQNYVRNLAANLDYTFNLPIESCEAPREQEIWGEKRVVQDLQFNNEKYWVWDQSVWWETPSFHIGSYVLNPVDENSNRNYRNRTHLSQSIFRQESMRFAQREKKRFRKSEGALGMQIVTTENSGPPPSEKHLSLWINRTRISRACGL